MDNNKEDGAIPFLDTIVTPEPDGKLSIDVYRKPTNMDQYLQWDSNHHLPAKYSVTSTLTHRAKIVSSDPDLINKITQEILSFTQLKIQNFHHNNLLINERHEVV